MVTIAEKKAIKAAKEQKRQIRMEISDLHENHCSTCKDPKKSSRVYCNTSCEFGKKIRHLGEILEEHSGGIWTGGVGVEIPKKLKPCKEHYLNLKEANVSDKKIAKIFEMSLSSLGDRKIEWDVIGVTIKPELTKTLLKAQEDKPAPIPAPAKEKKPIGRPRKNPAPAAQDPVVREKKSQQSLDKMAAISETVIEVVKKANEISLDKMAKAADLDSIKVENMFTEDQRKVISMVRYKELEAKVKELELERDGLLDKAKKEMDDQSGFLANYNNHVDRLMLKYNEQVIRYEDLFKQMQQQDLELEKCAEIIRNFQTLAKVAIESINKGKDLQLKYNNLLHLYQYGESSKDRMIESAGQHIRNLEAVLLDYLPEPE